MRDDNPPQRRPRVRLMRQRRWGRRGQLLWRVRVGQIGQGKTLWERPAEGEGALTEEEAIAAARAEAAAQGWRLIIQRHTDGRTSGAGEGSLSMR